MKKEELNTETAQQAPPIKKRLLSLDALRGITVAGMILVNNAGAKCRMHLCNILYGTD